MLQDTITSPMLQSHPRVLVVEDGESTRQHIAGVLRREGYEIAEAVDGLEALRKVSAASFDAIVLDLLMPNVNGWQFRQTQLRHPELAGIPTVIVTVRSLREPDRYVLQSDRVIQKPFGDSDLIEAVAEACQTKQPAVPPQAASTDQLFWSRRGEVACQAHAPLADSIRWYHEQWQAIPSDAAKHRIAYQCQHCPGRSGPIGHRPRATTA